MQIVGFPMRRLIKICYVFKFDLIHSAQRNNKKNNFQCLQVKLHVLNKTQDFNNVFGVTGLPKSQQNMVVNVNILDACYAPVICNHGPHLLGWVGRIAGLKCGAITF